MTLIKREKRFTAYAAVTGRPNCPNFQKDQFSSRY